MQKEDLITTFKNISHTGWISNDYRTTSSGNVGNILEDQLGIKENNLKLPDIGEYEIKAQKVKMQPNSLLSLFSCEPQPQGTVGNLINWFGWKPTIWRENYKPNERSFRQTLTSNFSDRGFRVVVLEDAVKVEFNAEYVSTKHKVWKESLQTFDLVEPYWKFDLLSEKLNVKLKNCIYSVAGSRTVDGIEQFHYSNTMIMEDFSFDRFLEQLHEGNILIDFNARSGHNHGTKFRCRQNIINKLYNTITYI
jgi:hypothetical protein